jgi:hypothetical protein
MSQDIIVLGQTFSVTCETELAGLDGYTCTIRYKRPDGVTGSLTPTVTGTTLIGTITPTENPVTGRAGKWSFYPNIISGAIVYKGATDHVIVSKEYQE